MLGMKGVQFIPPVKAFSGGCCSLHIIHMLQHRGQTRAMEGSTTVPASSHLLKVARLFAVKSLYVERGWARDRGNAPTFQGLPAGADNADSPCR